MGSTLKDSALRVSEASVAFAPKRASQPAADVGKVDGRKRELPRTFHHPILQNHPAWQAAINAPIDTNPVHRRAA